MSTHRLAIEGFLGINRKSINDSVNEIQGSLERAGNQGGKLLATEYEKSMPRVRRAIGKVNEITAQKTKLNQEDAKVQAKLNALNQKAIAIGDALSDQKTVQNELVKQESDLLASLTRLKAKASAAEKDLSAAEAKRDKLKKDHADTTKSELANIDQQIRALRAYAKVAESAEDAKAARRRADLMSDDSSGLRKRNIEELKAIADQQRMVDQLRDSYNDATAAVQATQAASRAATAARKKGVSELSAVESEHSKIVKESASVSEEANRISEESTKLAEKEEEAVRSLAEAKRAASDAEKNKRRGSNNGGSMGTLGSMLTDLPGVPGGRAGAVIGSGVLITLASVAEAAVTASQALAVLPAVATAGGAAMATLAIGTAGFADTIKHMGDPKKFAEGIAELSPNAQQAALQIQHLVDGPMGELKKATQDALFKDSSGMLEFASNRFGPGAQRLTTGIAGSMNNMMGNVLTEFATPDNMKSLETIINNILLAFQKLEPAVAPFADALLGIAETGSKFLPRLADAITNAANSFAKFIQGAQQDGTFEAFINKGIDATKMLIGFIGDLGKWVYQTFGNKSPEDFKATIESAAGAVKGVIGAIQGAANAVNGFLNAIKPVADALGGWENLATTALAVFVGAKMLGAIAGVMNLAGALGMGGVGGALSALPGLAAAAMGPIGLLAAAAGSLLYTLNKIQNAKQVPMNPNDVLPADATPAERATAQRGGLQDLARVPKSQGGLGPDPGEPGYVPPVRPGWGTPAPGEQAPGPAGSWWRSTPEPGGPRFPASTQFDIPPVPESGGGSKPSDSEKIAAELAKLNPSSFMPQIGAMPMGGMGDPREVQAAYQKVIEQARDVRDANMQLAAMQAAGVSSDFEILKAREKVADEEADFRQAQYDLAEKAQGKLSKLSDGFGQIGAQLDNDLGFSKGLPGLADNLVRFIAALATAPLQGMLAPMAAGAKGTGILGMLGYTGGNDTGSSTYGSYGTYGASYLNPGATTAYPGDAALLSRVPKGTYTQEARGDLTQGLADCSSAVEDLVNMLDGMPTSGANVTTANMEEFLRSRGFLPGPGGPGDMRVGFDSGHAQATLPGGTNFNWGSQAAADAGGRSGEGSSVMAQQFYRPVGVGGVGSSPGVPVPPVVSATPGATMPPAVSSTPVTLPPGLVPGPSTNTDPGLTPPLPPLPAPGSVPTGGPLSSGFPNALGPGMVTPSTPPTASYVPTTPEEQAAPSWTPEGGGNAGVGGGLIGAALSGAGGAANMMMPGMGAAADMAMKAINKTIAFGGKAAGIGMQGLMETFGVSDPDGGGNSTGASWLTRIAGGLAGARPATGMGAGQQGKNSKVDPNDPRNPQGQPGQPGEPGQGAQGGPQQTNHISIAIPPDRAGNAQQLANDVGGAMYNAYINPGG
jgi:hypothetical protein